MSRLVINCFEVLAQKIDGYCYLESASGGYKLGMSLKEMHNLNEKTGKCLTNPANHNDILNLVKALVGILEQMSIEWKAYWLEFFGFDYAWSFMDQIDWNFFIYNNDLN